MVNKSILLAALLLSPPSAFAGSQVSVEGAGYAYSCGYFSEQVEKLHVTYSNQDPLLPEATRMFLHWGLGGYAQTYQGNNSVQLPIAWQPGYTYDTNQQDVELLKTAPGQWEATFEAPIHDRTEPQYFNQFKFVVLQAQPSGNFYDPQGGVGHYYEADFLYGNGWPCVDGTSTFALGPVAVQLK